MMRTVNDIYHVEISRGMVKGTLISFGITAGFLFRLCAALCSSSPDEPSSALYRNIWLVPPPAVMDGPHDASFWVMIAFIFVFLMLFNKVKA